MKNLIILCAMAIVAVACNQANPLSTIPGTYVNNAGGEFSVANDTLIIEPSETNIFYIHRKTGFNLIRKGKIGKRQYETENWNAVYDDGTKTLTETKKGKLITFYPDSGLLKVGKRPYKKIN
jgi:hypothetical protein